MTNEAAANPPVRPTPKPSKKKAVAKAKKPGQLNVTLGEDYCEKFSELTRRVGMTNPEFLKGLISFLEPLRKELLESFVREPQRSPFETLYQTLEHWAWIEHTYTSEPAWAIETLDRFAARDQSGTLARLALYRRGLVWLQLATHAHAEAVRLLTARDPQAAKHHYSSSLQCARLAYGYTSEFLDNLQKDETQSLDASFNKASQIPVALFNRASCTSLILQLAAEERLFCGPSFEKLLRKLNESFQPNSGVHPPPAADRPKSAAVPALQSAPVITSAPRNPTEPFWKMNKNWHWWSDFNPSEKWLKWMRDTAKTAFRDLEDMLKDVRDSSAPLFVEFIVRRSDHDADLAFLRTGGPELTAMFSTWRGKLSITLSKLCNQLARERYQKMKEGNRISHLIPLD
jgi:hypothetical protein